MAIVAVVAILLGATAGYVVDVSFPRTTTSYITTTSTSKVTSTTTLGWTDFHFDASCPGCLQGGAEPPVPSYIISIDGVPITNWEGEGAEFVDGSNHTVLAAENYTGTCSGIPCNGQNITVYFSSWTECILDFSNLTLSTCSVLNMTDAHANPLMFTVPFVGENESISITGDYSPGAG